MARVSLDDALTDRVLIEAWVKVRGNEGCAGTDGEMIEDFEAELLARLSLLRDELRYGTYRPRPLLRVEIDKAGGGKRGLAIPAVRDRVLQTAVALVLTPVFEAEFEDCSFAYRKGRSVEQAVHRVESLRDQGFRWVVDADISAFFDNVDHVPLMREVERLVDDPRLLDLIRLWLDAEVIDGERRFLLQRGVPQGSPLSPLLSNLYLDHLDEALLDEGLQIVRFADDFLILCKDRNAAAEALELTQEVLERLSLELKEDGGRIVDFDRGFRFLGVQFIRSLAIKTAPGDPDPWGLSLSGMVPPTDRYVPRESGLTRPEEAEVTHRSAELGTAADADGSSAEPAATGMSDEDESAGERPEALAPAGHDPRLRTLYLLEHGYVLGRESERFVIRSGGEVIREIPAIKVDQIVVFGNSQITTQAMQFCLCERIPIFLMSQLGRFYGVIDSFDTDPVLLHREQFLRAADPAFCLAVARAFVAGKIANSRVILARAARKRMAPALRAAADEIHHLERRLDSAATLDQLRGFEGAAARLYFDALAKTLDAEWGFHGRVKRPPTDPVNALLSYGYTVLFYNIYSFLRAWGLNPHVGYLHPLRMGHAALASDLIEEFRAIVVDAVVFKLVLNRKVSPADFVYPREQGDACRMGKGAMATFIHAIEDKFNTPLRHPTSGLDLDYRRCIEHQVRHLAAVVRGREPAYRPIVLR